MSRNSPNFVVVSKVKGGTPALPPVPTNPGGAPPYSTVNIPGRNRHQRFNLLLAKALFYLLSAGVLLGFFLFLRGQTGGNMWGAVAILVLIFMGWALWKLPAILNWIRPAISWGVHGIRSTWVWRKATSFRTITSVIVLGFLGATIYMIIKYHGEADYRVVIGIIVSFVLLVIVILKIAGFSLLPRVSLSQRPTSWILGLVTIGVLGYFLVPQIPRNWLPKDLSQLPFWIGVCLLGSIVFAVPFTRWLWAKPVRAARLALVIVAVVLFGPSFLTWSKAKIRGWSVHTTPTIRNPIWVTARPDVYGDEVSIPFGYTFSCTSAPKGRRFQFIPNNDLAAAINLDGTPGEAHIPTDTRSIRVRSLENEPVVVQIVFTEIR